MTARPPANDVQRDDRRLAAALSRRAVGLGLAATAVAGLAPTRAAGREAVVVGALRFTSSGPMFLARDRAYFAAEGLDVDIAFFDAAPSIAVAVAAGDLTFGAAALTGAFFNLAGRGGLRILAGQAREQRGHAGNLVLVRRSAFEAGLASLPALFAHPFGLTQHGSPSHYQLGQLARLHDVAMSSIEIRAFHALPNLVAALKGGHAVWAIIAPPVASDLIAGGDMVAVARYSDYASYQFGVVFAAERTIEERAPTVRRFLRAYVRGLADYAVLNEAHATDAAHAARVRAAAAVIARYVYPHETGEAAVAKVRQSAFYVDPSGRVDVDDIARQIRWYREQGLMRGDVATHELLRLDLLP